MADWSEWLARTATRADDIVRGPAERLAATLGEFSGPYARDATALPPLWHWLYFLEAAPRAQIGADGHAEKGGFLPPIPLPRRMYAGGRFTFPGALRFGEAAEKRSSITAITEKAGKSGPLVFVTVRHAISQGGALAATEEHDIVYRGAPGPSDPPPAVPRPGGRIAAEETVTPDEVMLFRFSALTFNGHRIHYDYPYVTGVEGYPGLIVHGPLVAMLLFEAARRAAPERTPRAFAFRAISPFFCGPPLRLAHIEAPGSGTVYEARTQDDALVMTSTVAFAD